MSKKELKLFEFILRNGKSFYVKAQEIEVEKFGGRFTRITLIGTDRDFAYETAEVVAIVEIK